MEKHFLRGLCFTLYRLNYSQIFPLTVVLDVPPLPTPAAGGAGCAPRPPGLCGHGFRVNTKDRTAGTAHPQSDRSGGLPQGSKDGCCGTHPPRRAGNSASGPRSPSAVREGRKAVRGSWERVKGRWRGRPAVGSEHVQIATASTLRASVTGALRLSPPPVAGHPWTPVRRGPAAGGGRGGRPAPARDAPRLPAASPRPEMRRPGRRAGARHYRFRFVGGGSLHRRAGAAPPARREAVGYPGGRRSRADKGGGGGGARSRPLPGAAVESRDPERRRRCRGMRSAGREGGGREGGREGGGGAGARRELRGWGGWGCFSSEM